MKTLPKYFIILRDATNPLWDKYIQWLRETYKSPWTGAFYNYYYGYDGNTNNNYHGTDCYSNPQKFINNPTIITLDYWNECVNGFQLPEKWCIKNSPEIDLVIGEWFDKNIGRIPTDKRKDAYWHYPEISKYASSDSRINAGYTEITFEQFKKYVLKQDNMEKKLIGYKLNSKASANQVANVLGCANTVYSDGRFFLEYHLTGYTLEQAKSLGILDLWFEPVYEDLLESMVKEFTAKTGIEVGSTIVAPGKIKGKDCWNSGKEAWENNTAIQNRKVHKFMIHPDGTTLLIQVSGTTNNVWYSAYKMKLVDSTPSITIKGYKAEFTEDSVTFGCQTYSKEFVLTLAKCLTKNGFAMEIRDEIMEIAEYFESLD